MNATVEALLTKAKDAHSPADALHYSQAALNAANAVRVDHDVQQTTGGSTGAAS